MIDGNKLLFFSFMIEVLKAAKPFKKIIINDIQLCDKNDIALKNYFLYYRLQKEESFFYYLISKIKMLKDTQLIYKAENEFLFFSIFNFLYFVPDVFETIDFEKIDYNEQIIIDLLKISQKYKHFADNIINAYSSLSEPNLLTLISFIKTLNKQNYKTFFYSFLNDIQVFLGEKYFDNIYCYKDFFERQIFKKKLKNINLNKKYIYYNHLDGYYLYFNGDFTTENIFLYFWLQKYPNGLLFERFKILSVISAFMENSQKTKDFLNEEYLKNFLLKQDSNKINFKNFAFTKSFIENYNKEIVNSKAIDEIIQNSNFFEILKNAEINKTPVKKEELINSGRTLSEKLVELFNNKQNSLLFSNDKDQIKKLTIELSKKFLQILEKGLQK